MFMGSNISMNMDLLISNNITDKRPRVKRTGVGNTGFFNTYTETKHEAFAEEWENMPEFIQEQVDVFFKVILRVRNKEDLEKLCKLLDQDIKVTSKSIWYPKLVHQDHFNNRYVDEESE